MNEIYDVELDCCFRNEKYEGFRLNWDGDNGFGQVTFLKTENGIQVETETMADNEHKEFLYKIFSKFIEKLEVIE